MLLRSVLLAILGGALAVCGGASPDGTESPADAGGLSADTGAGPHTAATASIAFNSTRSGGDYDLFLVGPQGEAPRQLTHHAGRDMQPDVGPAGRRIAFTSARSGRLGIHVYEMATSSVTPVSVELGTAASPALSPDGQQIAFHGAIADADAHDIYLVSSTGGRARQITTHPARDSGPVWAPDGTRIYFVSNRTGTFEVHSMRPDGTDVQRITTGAGVLGRPAVAPDGRVVAYAQLVPGTQRSRIVAYHLGDQTSQVLTDQDDSEPAYSPDGRRLAFTSVRHGNPEVLLLELGSDLPPARLTHHPAIDSGPVFAPAP